MRVLLFHGYMLRGTGSNIYTANLARALAHLGHQVHLLCQDRQVRIEGVEIHNPDIHGLLPVYVKDPYEGFEVKAFPELSDPELDRYLDANVSAVRRLADAVGGFDAALAGHLITGPAVLARAEIGDFAAKVHGSALEYTVKPHPRFLPYAEEGMRAANCVLVGSRHTAESLWDALPDVPGLREKTRLGPPGVDTEAFRPRVAWGGVPGSGAASCFSHRPVGERGRARGEKPSDRPGTPPRDRTRGQDAQGRLRRQADRLQGGRSADCRLAPCQAAQPGGEAADRRVRGVRSRLEEAFSCTGRRRSGRCPRGRAPRLGARERFRGTAFDSRHVSGESAAWLRRRRRRGWPARSSSSGRLEHDEVAELLPGAEALVMPSTFPEAFGMVAAEAAACGVLPVSAGHSGMREVSRQLAAALPDEVAGLVSFPVGPGAVEAIADHLNRWLALPEGERSAARERLVETARRLWSWEGVARGVMAASAGRLGELPAPE